MTERVLVVEVRLRELGLDGVVVPAQARLLVAGQARRRGIFLGALADHGMVQQRLRDLRVREGVRGGTGGVQYGLGGPIRAPGHEFLDPALDVQGRSYGRDGGFTIEAVELGQIHDPSSGIS